MPKKTTSQPVTKSKVASNQWSEIPRLGMDSEAVSSDFQRHFCTTLAREHGFYSTYYTYNALAMTLRDRLMERWKNTRLAYEEADTKQVYYLSLEFLMGRAFGNAMLNLGLESDVKEAMQQLGIDLEELVESEVDAGLGNGGLGRLAACFIDSCATLQLPVIGYGIRYEYGMFRQHIENGYQVEEPDHWLINDNVWDMERPELIQTVRFGGRTENYEGLDGIKRSHWVDTHDVLAVPYDTPVPGYENGTVNTLRLWKAEATDEFDLDEFSAGSYTESVADKNRAEQITMVLYPNDSSENGKELRLRQQYFLASASLQDVLRKWTNKNGENFEHFAEKNCFQLNDTHPTLAIAELMRLLLDKYGLEWSEAWAITSKTMAYTNHTLLPEALEKWSVNLFRALIPRLLDIIFEINANFLAEVARKWPGDGDRIARMSLIEEAYGNQQVRMAYLGIVGSFSVNGVAQLHSDLLQKGLFKDFYELWPKKFNNKTNGVTPRRWMAWCNPELSQLITGKIGDGWITDLSQLSKLAPFADDATFRKQWRAVKRHNKERLVEYKRELGVNIHNIDAMFDIQVKRIHEYKRQLLNVLHVIHLYNRIKRGDTKNWTPRCVLIGGKAAPGYYMAKQIIKLINSVAEVVDKDDAVGDLLKLVFVTNYRVSAMEKICPGADLSEQISTAGKEASGTGNMKFMMNGALTIGTLDGANIEIREEVGEENFFLFGLTADEVEATHGNYDPNSIIENDSDFKQVMEMLECGHFNQMEPGIFDDIINSIRSSHDQWLTAADFRSFVDAQERVAEAYQDQEEWARMAILNCAASGKFSSDRTIADYSNDIWKLDPVPVVKK